MKIRNGFVSNSSSSSFLVAFPRFPKSAEDVQEMVFKHDKWFYHPYGGDNDIFPEKYTAQEIAEILWDKIRGQIPNNRKVAISRMRNVLVDDMDDYRVADHNQPQWRWEHDWEAYEGDNAEAVKKFMDDNAGSYMYTFELSDHDPKGCAMEHGDLFYNLPFLRSSNH